MVSKINKKHLKSIRSCPLFKDMTEEEVTNLLGCFNSRVQSFNRNDIANRVNETFDGIGVVLETGRWQVRKTWDRTILSLNPDLWGNGGFFRKEMAATVVAKLPVASCTFLRQNSYTGKSLAWDMGS